MIRQRMIYSGRVQGVGFRATAAYLARGYEVSGTVRNLADGTVELEAQGEAAEVGRFLAAIDEALGAGIDEARGQILEPIEQTAGFRIIY